VAREIARRIPQPDLAVPILTGAFVFAADLMRALAREGLSLPVEFLRFASYGDGRHAGHAPVLLAGADIPATGRTVLLIDGVLDSGNTLQAARAHLLSRGARAVVSVVAVDKGLAAAPDFALFSKVSGFIVGYGMDDAGRDRGLAAIARRD
jgi:hypoxanthine phosphoribosyltransferase